MSVTHTAGIVEERWHADAVSDCRAALRLSGTRATNRSSVRTVGKRKMFMDHRIIGTLQIRFRTARLSSLIEIEDAYVLDYPVYL